MVKLLYFIQGIIQDARYKALVRIGKCVTDIHHQVNSTEVLFNCVKGCGKAGSEHSDVTAASEEHTRREEHVSFVSMCDNKQQNAMLALHLKIKLHTCCFKTKNLVSNIQNTISQFQHQVAIYSCCKW
jgi:hypothetical protein